MQPSIGILLVNLGTPNSPSNADVYRYLIEFLTDERVIDSPWLQRQLLVRGLIVPFRYRQSARAYRHIWTEEGSPLKIYGRKVQQSMQANLGEAFKVELAMRYQEPTIEHGIKSLLSSGIKHLVVCPLFPQYASATTGSVHQKVMEIIKEENVIPHVTLIHEYATHPEFINAFCTIGQEYDLDSYDHILFSFHGLPKRHILKASPRGCCFQTPDCCQKMTENKFFCYSAQCYATAHAIASQLQLSENRYSLCFQSRLGKEPWLQPYASETILQLAQKGKKRVLVFCPSFVCDCLETIYEIGEEYSLEFKKAGGEALHLVHGLNDHPQWIEGLKNIILSYVPVEKEFHSPAFAYVP